MYLLVRPAVDLSAGGRVVSVLREPPPVRAPPLLRRLRAGARCHAQQGALYARRYCSELFYVSLEASVLPCCRVAAEVWALPLLHQWRRCTAARSREVLREL